ncbi:MAG: transcriptional repressor [Tissierellia bacterium]|nr:transcriptional repressor [Tissierellia bacterium]NLV77237.1 transcriptional repressor [Tissierellia bacterium]
MLKYIDNKDIFKECGIKKTKQRNILLNILKEEEEPLTAEEIFIKARERDKYINLSTIYRTLNIFISKDIAIKLNLEKENKSMFQLNMMDHQHHIRCISCNKKIRIDKCPIIGYEYFIEENTNFHIIGHKLELYGYCSKCKDKKQ